MEIKLTQGQVAIVDEEGFKKAGHLKWYAKRTNGSFFYAARGSYVGGKVQTQLLHRFLTDAPNGMVVDHINHNTLDCRFENMRLCTHAENMRNRTVPSGSISKYLGVGFYKITKRWHAKIRSRGHSTFLGYFDNEIDAAKAYDKAAKEIHGEFANLNFPESETV